MLKVVYNISSVCFTAINNPIRELCSLSLDPESGDPLTASMSITEKKSVLVAVQHELRTNAYKPSCRPLTSLDSNVRIAMVVLILIHALSSALPSSSVSCNDVHDCRTIASIVFNCASTVFLCTWVALHLDVPENPQMPWWKRCLHRIKWVGIALLAPEFIFGKAFIDWTVSCDDLKDKLSEFGATIHNWTLYVAHNAYYIIRG